MAWDEFIEKAARISAEKAAGALIVAGMPDNLSIGAESPELIPLHDPFHIMETAVPPLSIESLARQWKDKRGLSPLRYSVERSASTPIASIARMFSAVSPRPAAWSIALPERDRPVEFLWPLRIGVAAGPQFQSLQDFFRFLRNEYGWLRRITDFSPLPAGSDGTLDIAIVTADDPWRALSTNRLPLIARTLLLAPEHPNVEQIAACIPELAARTRAQAVILMAGSALRTGWLKEFVEAFSHNHTWDMAAALANIYALNEKDYAILFATRAFLVEGHLSQVEEKIRNRLSLSGGTDLGEPPATYGVSTNADFEAAVSSSDAYHHESGTAAFIAQFIKGISPLPPGNDPRFVQARMLLEKVAVEPQAGIEANKLYELEVRVGPGAIGWSSANDTFPEPPLKPEEASLVLTVLFHERNSCPEGVLRTIELPRNGASSTAEFDVVVSAAAPMFDGRVTVFHNNRPLTECAYLAAVKGAKGPASLVRAGFFSLMRTRDFDPGLNARLASAGTLRVEDEYVIAVRGEGNARIPIAGYKQALQAMEKAINDVDLDSIWPGQVLNSPDAAELLIALARNGYYLHQQLMTSEVMQAIYEDGGVITIFAADAETRAPLEACYALEEPASDARICPSGLEAAGRGECVKDCEGSKDPEHHVCPAGFWGLRRCLEWRSLKSDLAKAGETLVAPAAGRQLLKPLRQIAYAWSERVTSVEPLPSVLKQAAAPAVTATKWKEWAQCIHQAKPSMIILMPHIDKTMSPPVMEIRGDKKDPRGVKAQDVTVDTANPPVVILLGCGAAAFRIDYQSLPNQFRRNKAAMVIAPMAEILARDAPELACLLVNELHAGTEERPLAEAVLAAKRAAVSAGYLSALLLLSVGDADWTV